MDKTLPIKVCGITRLEDAQLALDLGAFALGFIFYPRSPRYIAPEKVRDILGRVQSSRPFLKVGVVVNATSEELKEIHAVSGIDILQLHGDETPAFVQSLTGYRLWKAFRLKDAAQLEALPSYQSHVEAFLFDAAVSGQYGGTGHRLEEALLAKIPRTHPFLLAGGLDASNAKEVYAQYKPWALDLSSGVESSPGIKDSKKLQALFAK